jgi:hypothetical protein
MGRVGVIIPVLVMCGLLVPACSSGSSAAPKKTSPARVTTETVRVGRFTQIFDTPLPADPAQASVVEGFRTAMILWDKSQETLRLVSPVTTHVTGGALRNLKASLVRAKADEVVLGGADRFFKTRVAVISGTSATITTCDDGSKFEEVNPSTGVPDPAYSAPANQQYLFETWQMIRLGGHWAISVVSPVTLPDSRAKPCQPLPALDRRVGDLAGAAGERDAPAAVTVLCHRTPVAGSGPQPDTTPVDRHTPYPLRVGGDLRGTVQRAKRACLALRVGNPRALPVRDISARSPSVVMADQPRSHGYGSYQVDAHDPVAGERDSTRVGPRLGHERSRSALTCGFAGCDR